MSANPVFCAVDTSDLADACALARRVAPDVGGLKIGLEFWNACGAPGVRKVMKAAGDLRLFLDLKLHDIPNTVAGAVTSLSALPVAVLTVHAGGGPAMLRAAKEAAPETMAVVGVTVLTSLDAEDLRATGITGDPREQVLRLARLSRECGLDGIVCSPQEVRDSRAEWPEGLLVVPGIRPPGTPAQDQKRTTLTPAEARAAGADILVIGRPITQADDPAAAAKAIADSL